MKLGTKILLCILGAAALIIGIYQGYLTFRYRLHRDYRNVLTAPAEFEAGTPFSGTSDSDAPAGMVLAANNEMLKLFVNPETAEVAVFDRRTGVTTFTNPPGAADDPIAGEVNKSFLQSQLIVEFYDSNRLPGIYNSFGFSTSLGQFEFESLVNGLRITYTLGDMSYQYGSVPLYISAERLEFFTSRLDSERDARDVTLRYEPSDEAPGFLQLNEASRTGQATLRRLNERFEEMGYTETDLMADLEASGAGGAIPIAFVVPLEYRLDGDSLVVSIPTGQITEKGGGRLFRIQLLRSFGAGGAEEEGYLMVPNGSGSIIYFNNGKTFADDYMQYVYDLDPLMQEFIVLGNSEPARMPYFGIQRTGANPQGILAEIQSGDTLSDITASVAGIIGIPAAQNKTNSYNYVYPSFTLRGSLSLAMFGSTGNEAELPVVEMNFADVDLVVRYSFLTNEHYGYSGMARYARESLIERGVLTPNNAAGGDDIPFYMSLLGSTIGQRRFLSVGYFGQFPVTTFAQAKEISDTLAASGIANQVINYQGWFNRGYYHDVPDRIRLVRQLGDKSELENLSQRVESMGGKLFLDVAFQQATFASRRFNWQIETSRYYGPGMVAIQGFNCPDCYGNITGMGYRERLHCLVSPKFLGRYVDDFLKAFGRYNVTGISLRDLGDDLHSDRKRTEMINREEARDIVVSSFGRLAGAVDSLMVSGGNAYSFAFGSDFINVPISHNAIYIVDEEIPFYHMLLSGSANYAGPPINLSSAFDEDEIIARLVEFGASPHFTFTAEASAELKYTGKNHVHASTFDNWRDSSVRIYSAVNEVLSRVSGSAITEHEVLPDGQRRVTYDNGVIIEIDGNNVSVGGVAR
ncbi:MAG: DUF5696 domain-containing protein [Oscillospiraceae bacterium]|jgi:hypothetical protein|nr:DUF5696 domain-containing protein [Oscillospiraceae bacterium]